MSYKRRVDIATDVETISNVTTQRSLVNNAIQTALDRVFEYHDWPYYVQEAALLTKAPYETGTVSVTNGSKTVTGSGTSWDSSYTGRKFRVANENGYYRIATVDSTTQITLEQPIQGDTQSGVTYSIFKDEYRLAADVDRDKTFRQNQNGVALYDMPISSLDAVWPTPTSYADPTIKSTIGTKLDIYSTGTVTGVAAATTITGSGTSWTSLEGLTRLSLIRIGDNVYTVKSVDSDTQITIYEGLISAFSASTYEINLNNIIVQLTSIPDAQTILYYRYFRRPAYMANNYDTPDMPHSWNWLLKFGALSEIFLQKGDINKAQQEAEGRFMEGLAMMKLKIGSFAADRIYKRKSIDRISNTQDGIERSAFDRRYSQP